MRHTTTTVALGLGALAAAAGATIMLIIGSPSGIPEVIAFVLGGLGGFIGLAVVVLSVLTLVRGARLDSDGALVARGQKGKAAARRRRAEKPQYDTRDAATRTLIMGPGHITAKPHRSSRGSSPLAPGDTAPAPLDPPADPSGGDRPSGG